MRMLLEDEDLVVALGEGGRDDLAWDTTSLPGTNEVQCQLVLMPSICSFPFPDPLSPMSHAKLPPRAFSLKLARAVRGNLEDDGLGTSWRPDFATFGSSVQDLYSGVRETSFAKVDR